MGADAAGRDLSSGTVFMVQHGILGGWVCAPKGLSLEDVQIAVHRDIFPAGTSGGWIVQERRDDTDEKSCSPGLCAEDDAREHWHVLC